MPLQSSALNQGTDEFASRVEACFPAERRRLLRKLHELSHPAAPKVQAPADGQRQPQDSLEAFLRDLAAAEARVAARKARIPRPTFPTDLPVSLRRDDIAAAIRDNQVVVIAGETGSGKTTQIPKICLELGRGVFGMIGHTQPRRIAARSVAQRIASELGTKLGDIVGYKVRFGDSTGPNTVVKLMTDGVLLAETQSDRLLHRYDTIIIDEAHERSLNIDFLLGYLRTILPKRRDLKVIITSATIDPERFSTHFFNCPILKVSGRTYPVEVLYRAPHGEDEDARDDDADRALLNAVDEAASYGPGDILMFFSGEREIREAAELLHKHKIHGTPKVEILPLFAKLSAEDQLKVFDESDPYHTRRVVLATNVAETSLTVPGIRFVIDTGKARLNRYSPRSRVQRLEIEAISQASADQRKGRCGRVGPGVCIRLYSQTDFEARGPYTDPEIVRTNLAAVILQMASLRLGKVEEFPFLDPPDSRLIRDGYDTLIELGAMTPELELTPLGTQLAKLPIDPRIGRMIIAGAEENCLTQVLIIAAALAVQDPRDRPMDKQADADDAHAPYKDPHSDLLSWLVLWNAVRNQKRALSGGKLRKWCREKFLSFVRLREWDEMHHQLADLAGDMGLHANTKTASPDAIHRALLAGLLSSIGTKSEVPGEYAGARGLRFYIFPGSVLINNKPKWLMAAEITRTTRVYARGVASISPEFIERVGAHLLKKTHYDPHWDRQAGRVMCLEKVSLFGLELANRRRAHYGAIDPHESRRLFIHHALVEGDMDNDAPFLQHNHKLLTSLRELERRARRQDLVTETAARFEYFNSRIPPDVFTVGAFERWRRVACRGDAKFLFMTLADLAAQVHYLPTAADFPDELSVGELRVPLEYTHKVGDETDGVTIRLPIEALGQLDVKRLEWLVPGYTRDKAETVLRNTTKDYRRMLPSAGALAEKFLSENPWGVGEFYEKLAATVQRASSLEPAFREGLLGALRAALLPDYLRMRIEVLGKDGQILYAGRDVAQLRATLTPKLRQTAMQSADQRYKRDGIKVWDVGDLPERIEIERLGVSVAAYPALEDHKSSVGLRLFESPGTAEVAHRAGVRRLYILDCAEDLRRYSTRVHGIERMSAYFAPLGGGAVLKAGLQELIADRAFISDRPPVRTQREYFARRAQGLDRLGASVSECCDLMGLILTAFHQVQLQLAGKAPTGWEPALNDVRDQLAYLFAPGFFTLVHFTQLQHYPRYLAAIQTRLRKLPGEGLIRDRKHAAELAPLWRGAVELLKRQDALGLSPTKVAEYRWLCEEFRVSLFAQDLRTAVPVSSKRLQEVWASVVK